jgi:hypothetical protein
MGTATWTGSSFAVSTGTVIPGTSTITLTGTGTITNNTGSTVTLYDVNVTGVQHYFLGNSGFIVRNFTVVAGATVGNFPGMTVTFSNITINGTSGSHVIIANSSAFTWSCGGTVTVTYADINNCTAAGASIPVHDQNGVDNGGNTNWLFDRFVALTDLAGITDTQTTMRGYGTLIADTIGLHDTAAAALTFDLAELVGITDPLQALAGAVTLDTIDLLDDADAVIIRNFIETILETVNLVDTAGLIDLVIKLDDVNLADDGFILDFGYIFTDTLDLDDLADAVFTEGLIHVHFDMTLTATERQQRVGAAGRTLTLVVDPAIGVE